MSLSIATQQELLSRLVAQMGQGGTSGNSGNIYGGLEPPRQADIAAFKAAAHPSDLRQSGNADGGLPASQIDDVGNSKATAALAEVYNAGNTQQADRLGQRTAVQQDENVAEKAEKSASRGKSALDEAAAAKMEKEQKKQDAINALIALIQGLEQKLSVLDVKIGAAIAEKGSGMEGAAPDVGKLVAQRSKLVSQIEQLQQKLQALLAS